MKRRAIVFASALTALLFAVPVSGQSVSVVCFSDRLGDLGHPMYELNDDGQWDPVAFWPDTSPVGDAGYLDILQGEMSLDDSGVLTATLIVAEPVTDQTVLPNSVTEVWWTWFFYLDTSYFPQDFSVHVCWAEDSLECLMLQRGEEAPLGSAISYSVTGTQITVVFDPDLIGGSVAWFAESICWMKDDPHPELGALPTGGWYAADITDGYGPDLPWQPMPV